ncbi:MAG: acetolactate synthase small subunit [Pseudomonadales bacterium]
MRHIISLLMENEAGALSRVIGLFAQRGYNIETLSVAPTDDATLSRLTLTTLAGDDEVEQITKQLNKLIEVVKLVDLTRGDHVELELMLVKVKPADADQRTKLEQKSEGPGIHVIDTTQDIYTIQVTGSSEKLDGFLRALPEDGIMEVVRSGALGVAKGEKVLALASEK